MCVWMKKMNEQIHKINNTKSMYGEMGGCTEHQTMHVNLISQAELCQTALSFVNYGSVQCIAGN